MKIRNIIGGIAGYLASLAIAMVFALYMSGRIGWFLVLVMLLAMPFSFITTFIAAKQLRLYSDCGDSTLTKGANGCIRLTVKNRSFFPSPVIVMDIEGSPNVTADKDRLYISVLPRREEEIEAEFSAQICGRSFLGISSVYVRDPLGIFKFKPTGLDITRLGSYISVIPDIEEIPYNNDIMGRITQASALADDGEDTVENSTNKSGGFPGYESREYVAGDPLKRINWKMSAKRDKLLIRLDDETDSSSVSVVLDSVLDPKTIKKEQLPDSISGADENKIIPLIAQAVVERSLGIVKMLTERGVAVNYYMLGINGWESYAVNDERDLTELRITLAAYSFADEGEEHLPYDEIMSGKGRVAVLCTPSAAEDTIGEGKDSLSLVVCSVMNGGGAL